MKKCLRCNSDFTPKNPKGKFCSDKCRVYSSRGSKPNKPNWAELAKDIPIIKREEVKKIKDPAPNEQKVPKIPLKQKTDATPPIDKAAKIKAFEEEYAAIPDIGLGKQRRKWIEKQIADLKAGR